MVRIIEHRSALPNGLILAVHVRHDPNADPSVFAKVAVELFGQSQSPETFLERLPVEEGFLQALAYAEHAGITVIWIDDHLKLHRVIQQISPLLEEGAYDGELRQPHFDASMDSMRAIIGKHVEQRPVLSAFI